MLRLYKDGDVALLYKETYDYRMTQFAYRGWGKLMGGRFLLYFVEDLYYTEAIWSLLQRDMLEEIPLIS